MDGSGGRLVVANGHDRGCLPADHPRSFDRARATAFAEAGLVLVAGTPLDVRPAFGAAAVVHLVTPEDQLAHLPLAAGVAGPLPELPGALAAPAAREDRVARPRAEEVAKPSAEPVHGTALSGYDVAAGLQPGHRDPEVVRAVGGRSEL